MRRIALGVICLGLLLFAGPPLWMIAQSLLFDARGVSNSDPGAGAVIGSLFVLTILVSPVGIVVTIAGAVWYYAVKVTRDADAERASNDAKEERPTEP